MEEKWIEKLTKEDIDKILEIWIYEQDDSEWELESYILKKDEEVIDITIKTKTWVDMDEDGFTIMDNEEVYILSDFGMSLCETDIDDPTETYNDRLIEYREFMLDRFGNDYALDYLFDLTDSSFSYEYSV